MNNDYCFAVKVEMLNGNVYEVAIQMVKLANRIDHLVMAEFNGVLLWARPGDDWRGLVRKYEKETS